MATIIKHVRVFDGNSFHQNKTILINDGIIAGIDSAIPSDANVIDAAGCTLLPGLIDSHVHTKIPELEIAIKFGVTTELEMMGHQTPQQRQEVSERNDIADLRTAEFGMTAPGGHPYELYKRGPVRGSPPKPEHAQGGPPPHTHAGPPQGMQGTTHPRTATTPSEARDFVAARIADGADYIKIMIEEGSVLEEPGLPLLSQETIEAAVQAAHAGDKIAIAHALTAKATEQAIGAGVDGLAHIFLDGPHTKDLVNAIAKAGTFVTPCICLNASIMGHTGEELAKDERVASKLPKQWLETLRSSFNTYPQGRLEDVLETVGALHKAGVSLCFRISVPSTACKFALEKRC